MQVNANQVVTGVGEPDFLEDVAMRGIAQRLRPETVEEIRQQKNDRASVKDVVEAANKALGSAVTVTRFARLKVGEAG